MKAKDAPKRHALMDRITEALKTNAGCQSREIAKIVGSHTSDVSKALNQLRHDGKVYSSPSSRNNAHQWHLCGVNLLTIKSRLTSQLWNKNINLEVDNG